MFSLVSLSHLLKIISYTLLGAHIIVYHRRTLLKNKFHYIIQILPNFMHTRFTLGHKVNNWVTL